MNFTYNGKHLPIIKPSKHRPSTKVIPKNGYDLPTTSTLLYSVFPQLLKIKLFSQEHLSSRPSPVSPS